MRKPKKEIIEKDVKLEIIRDLSNRRKMLVMLAPSFVVNFRYPGIVGQLKKLGFDKVVELTFGAKMVNKEYHQLLEKNKDSGELVISSVCPGIFETITNKYPEYAKNLAKIDSPMIATAKICKKYFPEHKIVFIAPCNFKKIEANKRGYIDYVIDYNELKNILDKSKAKSEKASFDKFYNDYTKIYPLSGGLSRTAHLKQVLKKGEEKVIDGILNVEKFLDNPDKKVRFLDVTYCEGGCIGGPCTPKNLTLTEKRKLVIKYLEQAEEEKIPEGKLGLIEKAEGLSFEE